MRICVTGSDGYIGSVLTGALANRGHRVTGLDSELFADCVLAGTDAPKLPSHISADVRLIPAGTPEGADAVIHLAGLSNDPMGDLDPSLTHAINTQGTIRVAEAAKRSGVHHFIFASSCSVYGSGAGDQELTELSSTRPLTAYAQSKLEAEHELQELADDEFRVTALRAATVFGMSPRLRLDLVINELTATAAIGQAPLLKSTGTAWRPFIHVYDLASAYAEVTEIGPADPFNVFNVGNPAATTRIVDLAETVSQVTGVPYEISSFASPDTRNYRVGFERFQATYPGWRPAVNIREGVADMVDGFRSGSFSAANLESTRYRRLPRLHELLNGGAVDDQLFPRTAG